MVSWLTGYFKHSNQQDKSLRGNLTFGQTTFSKTFRSTGQFFRQQVWVWPLVAFVILATLGYFVNGSIKHSIESSLQSELSTLLHVERSMVEKWLQHQESNAIALASLPDVRAAVLKILDYQESMSAGKGLGTGEKPLSEEIEEWRGKLKQFLLPGMSAHHFIGYIVVDREQRVIAAQTKEIVGQVVPQYSSFLNTVMEGETTVSAPFPSAMLLRDPNGTMRAEVPTMFALSPVRNEDFQTVACIGFRIRPEREFTEILQLGQMGDSGETYAVDKNGLMVSNSRFDEQLILSGLIPDRVGAASILSVQARDPGGSLLDGYRPKVRRGDLPFTFACASALEGKTGVSLDGHRNYRGVPAISAWTWLPKYEMGIITEIDAKEAFQPLSILRWTFFSLFFLLILTAVAIFVFTLVVARMQQEAREAAIEAKELGQYRLETLLGTGAMGVVYKGHHSMMRRPTAIKLLKSENVSPAAIERFEHEVQITCQLNNPHTIAIYDYGRTPEGVFYYAMEYLDGINLQSLVDRYGPQPAGRVVEILKQICSSLYEAHSLGLVHRDIKPANIMLNRRGGECDVVKVLDFGLVRSLEEDSHGESSKTMTGTPMYMSPEAIQNPKSIDVRSDIYSLGAVGYFLLTGHSLFQATSLGELFQHHIDSVPLPPSQRSGVSVDPQLEGAIMACLEKSRANRPQTAKDLAIKLELVATNDDWCREKAEAWWLQHERESRHDRDVPQGDDPQRTPGTSSNNKTVANGKTEGPSAKTVSGFETTMVHGQRE
ncbi:serine/threonine protein kinase [Pirellulaceae bacterium SH467]